jgi:mannose-6-phosphate isomerase-like protein (cupin superfamily)
MYIFGTALFQYLENMRKVTTLNTAVKVPFDLDGRIMHTGTKTEIIRLILKEEETLEKHGNPMGAVFYILKGEGLLIVDEEHHHMQKDNCIYIEKDVLRSWENTGTVELEILVIKEV